MKKDFDSMMKPRTDASEPPVTRASRSSLAKARDALKRYAGVRAALEERGAKPEVGDLFVFYLREGFEDTPIEWAVLVKTTSASGAVYCVVCPSDWRPFVGAGDVATVEDDLGGRRTLRCRFPVNVPEWYFYRGQRTGLIGRESCDIALRSLCEGLDELFEGDVGERSVDSFPAYESWLDVIEEVVERFEDDIRARSRNRDEPPDPLRDLMARAVYQRALERTWKTAAELLRFANAVSLTGFADGAMELSANAGDILQHSHMSFLTTLREQIHDLSGWSTVVRWKVGRVADAPERRSLVRHGGGLVRSSLESRLSAIVGARAHYARAPLRPMSALKQLMFLDWAEQSAALVSDRWEDERAALMGALAPALVGSDDALKAARDHIAGPSPRWVVLDAACKRLWVLNGRRMPLEPWFCDEAVDSASSIITRLTYGAFQRMKEAFEGADETGVPQNITVLRPQIADPKDIQVVVIVFGFHDPATNVSEGGGETLDWLRLMGRLDFRRSMSGSEAIPGEVLVHAEPWSGPMGERVLHNFDGGLRAGRSYKAELRRPIAANCVQPGAHARDGSLFIETGKGTSDVDALCAMPETSIAQRLLQKVLGAIGRVYRKQDASASVETHDGSEEGRLGSSGSRMRRRRESTSMPPHGCKPVK